MAARAVNYPRLRAAVARRAASKGALLAGCLAVAGCGFFGQQVARTAVDLCIEKQCENEHDDAWQQCVTACQREYGH